MSRSTWRVAAGLLAAALGAACAGSRASTAAGPAAPAPAPAVIIPGGVSPAEQARADSGRPPFTDADVKFMSGMIHHHTQAIAMAGWAKSHGASPGVVTLAGRIDVAQRDEIGLIQRWLKARGLPVPNAEEMIEHSRMGMTMGEMMPGMLTGEQLQALDAARGTAFDRLFLTDMIMHHTGAVTMVHDLFAARGAGQDITVFRFASDVEADQTTEIDRMTSMLERLPSQ